MPREVIRQLKNLQQAGINPSTEWLTKNRALLLSQIKNTVPEVSTSKTFERAWAWVAIFIPKPLVYNVVRPVAALLVVAIVATTAYSGTVKASYETLPGDWLYSAKRATEQTQVAMASIVGDKNTETKLHVEFAKRRASETNQIIRNGDPSKVAKVSATVTDLKNEIATINSKLDETKDKATDNGLQADVAKDVKQQTDQINDVLQDAKNSLLVNPSTDQGLSQQISDTKNLVKDVSVKAVEVMVAKHLEGDTSVSKEEVKEAISSALQASVSSVGESKQNVDGATTILETAKSDAKDLAKTNTSSIDVAVAKELAAKIFDAASTTKAAVIETKVATDKVAKSATEGQQLVASGDLVQAVDKLKEVNQTAQAIEKISDTTVAKAQLALPVVTIVIGSVGGSATSGVGVVSVSATTSVPLVSSTSPSLGASSTNPVTSTNFLQVISATTTEEIKIKK